MALGNKPWKCNNLGKNTLKGNEQYILAQVIKFLQQPKQFAKKDTLYCVKANQEVLNSYGYFSYTCYFRSQTMVHVENSTLQ